MPAAHGLKFGFSAERGQKQQNFQNQEMGELQFDPWATGGTGGPIADLLTGRLANYTQGTPIPQGEWRYWNIDGFAQDSWKIRPNFTLEFGVRAGFWTNNNELNDMGGHFDPSFYDPTKRTFLDPGTFQQLNGWRYASRGQAPQGGVDNRSPFAMPRLNVAWDIDRQRQQRPPRRRSASSTTATWATSSTTTCAFRRRRMPVSINSGDASSLGNGVGLTYDTIRQLDWTTRVGSIDAQHAEPRLEQVAEDLQLQRVRTPGGSSSTRSSRRPTSARGAATW